jgi:hypothetical protein
VADPSEAGPAPAARPKAPLDSPEPAAPALSAEEPPGEEPPQEPPAEEPPAEEPPAEEPPEKELPAEEPPAEEPEGTAGSADSEDSMILDAADADLPVMDPRAEPPAADSGAPPEAPPARAAPGPLVRFIDRVVLLALLVEVAAVVGVVRYGLSQPFWYDEQQRAYQLALPMRRLWEGLADAELPLPLGWIAVEKGFAATFGQVEWALRLPIVVSVVVLAIATYAVARRFVGVVAAALTAGALVANGFLAPYIPQIKQYPAEMALTMVALLLWLQAGDPGRSRWDQAGRYLGVLLCLLTSIATAFVVAPLLALDLARVVRGRRMLPRALMALVTGAVALAHLVVFVLPQNKAAGPGSYWELTFMPTSSLGAATEFVVRQAQSFVPGLVTHPGAIVAASPARWITALVLVGLAATTAVALVDRRVRPLLVALGGALLLQLVASGLRLWPFGLVRVNLFLIPLLYLIVGIGAARTLALLARASIGRGPWRRPLWGRPLTGVCALALAGLVAVGGSAGVRASTAQLNSVGVTPGKPGWSVGLTGWGEGLRGFVERTRLQAGPNDVVVVVRRMGFKGWSYYMWSYTGWPASVAGRPPVDQRRTLMMDAVDEGRLRAFLAEHHNAERVFVVLMASAYRGSKEALARPLRQAGRVEVEHVGVPSTGTLAVWTVQKAAAQGGRTAARDAKRSAGAFDHAGSDRPAAGRGAVVAEEVPLGGGGAELVVGSGVRTHVNWLNAYKRG